MAFTTQAGGYGNGRRRGRYRPLAEINVTPMVDVMLVLLIIFMVTAPLLVTGVPIDLPDSKAKALKSDDTPIQISIDKAGQVFIDKLAVPAASLPAKLAALREARSGAGDEARVYVRADKGLDYGAVMAIVGEVSAAGFRKVALISDSRIAKPPAAAEPAAP
jgi:biopolymer transport protein TolR